MTSNKNPTETYGARLLKEISAEETTLEDVLTSLRKQQDPHVSITGIQELDALCCAHGGRLTATGRTLPLLCQILVALVGAHHGTVSLIDLTEQFSPLHLVCSLEREELKHIHVFRATRSNLRETLESVEAYMLYGEHGSKGRAWKGTIVNGGDGLGLGEKGNVIVSLGWRGWLRVERDVVAGFGSGISAEEAVGERETRWTAARGLGWRAICELGEYTWR